MAQTQTAALYIQAADQFPDSSATTRFGGDIVVVGGLPLPVLPTDPNLTGVNTFAAEGVWDVPKDTSTFSAMDAVYWNATGNPVLGTAGTGCATSTQGGNKFLGRAIQAQLTGDNYVRTFIRPLDVVPAQQASLTAIAASGAIGPHTNATYVITKAGVAAETLAAPTATTDDGVTIQITSNTAFAHTLTATGLLQTGSASVNVATFAAFAGASLTLMAYQGKWNVLNSNGITFS